MPHTITLTEKASNFVESRRGSMLHSDYVNLLLENIESLSKECLLMQDEASIVEAIESYRPIVDKAGNVDPDFVAGQIIEFLSEVFHGKVPVHVFEKKCAERGLKPDQISNARKMYGSKLR